VESEEAETVKDSVDENSVVTPAESFGVMVIVADSPFPTVAEVDPSENVAGTPATVHVTVADEDNAPGAELSSVLVRLSVQIEYVIVARPTVRESPSIGRTIAEVPDSGIPLRRIAVCNVVVFAAAPLIAVRAISFALTVYPTPEAVPPVRAV